MTIPMVEGLLVRSYRNCSISASFRGKWAANALKPTWDVMHLKRGRNTRCDAAVTPSRSEEVGFPFSCHVHRRDLQCPILPHRPAEDPERPDRKITLFGA